MTESKNTVVAVLSDLMFRVRIQEAAKVAGLNAIFVQSMTEALASAEKNSALIIIDLNYSAGEPLELIGKLKQGEQTRKLQMIGYVSHVQTDLIRAARDKGCDVLLARSAFSEKLPAILAEYAGRK